MHVRFFTSKRALSPIIAGILMDVLYYHLFQASKIRIILPIVKEGNLNKTNFDVD